MMMMMMTTNDSAYVLNVQVRCVMAFIVGLVESAKRQQTDNKNVSAISTVITPGFSIFYTHFNFFVLSFTCAKYFLGLMRL